MSTPYAQRLILASWAPLGTAMPLPLAATGPGVWASLDDHLVLRQTATIEDDELTTYFLYAVWAGAGTFYQRLVRDDGTVIATTLAGHDPSVVAGPIGTLAGTKRWKLQYSGGGAGVYWYGAIFFATRRT